MTGCNYNWNDVFSSYICTLCSPLSPRSWRVEMEGLVRWMDPFLFLRLLPKSQDQGLIRGVPAGETAARKTGEERVWVEGKGSASVNA